MKTRYDVFLSHASADKPAVEYLARKLRAIGIELFLDKWHLIPGEPWQEALEEALDQSQTCAVFLGPKGIGAWQNEEMRDALDERVRNKSYRVIPVLLPGSFEPHKEELPRFLRRLNWVDFRSGLDDEEAFRRLASGIQGIAPGPGGAGVESLQPKKYRSMAQAPEEFIQRREYEDILRALCPVDGSVQFVGITTALQGAGGFGKTALAQKLCQDERVQEFYPDGILWTTMGEDIDANGRLSRIRDLIRWWTGEEPPAFETSAAAGASLRELLASARALIVVDDVWSSADLTPFHGIGASLLITTRDSQTLPLVSKRIEVDAMASSEARSLLQSGLPEEQDREFDALADRLGEWPILLTLANRQLRDLVIGERLSVQTALKEVNEALTSEGFVALDRGDQDSRNVAASKTILASVQRLQEKERERYIALSVFPEDAKVPISVLEKQWGIGSGTARRFCRRLHDLSLLRDLDSEKGTIRLHDVVRQVLIEQVGDQLPSLHQKLLDVFRAVIESWSYLDIKEDYLWRNLASHLLGAKQKGELRRLLTDFSYIQAKLNATDVNSLISDYTPMAQESRELKLIQDALRLSAHVLLRDRQQLASQILGRLAGAEQDFEQLLGSTESQLRLIPRPGSLMPAGGPLIRTLEGHSGWVTAVAVLDGRRAVSASDDQTLRVWDLETGETFRTLEGHSGWVTAVAVLDGRRVVSASDDKTLRVWDLETGETIRILEAHSGRGTAVAVLDGRRVVSTSDDKTLRVWDLETGETLRTLEGHSGGVTAVAVVDGRRAISASDDKTLRMWDLETGETLRTLEGHSGDVNAVAVLDGRRAVSASDDQTLRVWDLETGETLRTLEGHSDWVRAVAVIDGHRAVSGSDDQTLRVWDLETGETLRTLEEHSDWVRAVAVVDGHRAASGSNDQTLRVWDLETGETLRTLEGHSNWVNAVAVLDGGRVVSGSDDQTLRVWDLETGETLRTLEGHWDWVNAVAVLDGGRVLSGSSDHTLRVWDLETGKTLRSLERHWGDVNAVAVLDGGRVVSGSNDYTLRVWDLETGEALRTLEGHSGDVNAVAVLDGGRVVSGSNDQTLRVWDLETGKTLRSLEGHSNWVRAVAVLDGGRVVSGSNDQTLRVWDLETGKAMAVVTLDAPVLAVAVSPDGRVVAAGDSKGRVHFLDLHLERL